VIAILGAGGQVGRELSARAAALGLRFQAFGHQDCDITNPASVVRALGDAHVAVNGAAFTAVDRAETETTAAFAVNRDGAAVLARACGASGLPLIHLSTDYVFNGRKAEPWCEDDPTAPIQVYGASKLAGEAEIRRAGRHIILRTSWVFSPHPPNFVRTILRLASEREEIAVVDDQRGGPTPADALAETLLRLAGLAVRPDFTDWGTYHYAGAPAVTWHEFAAAVLAARDRPRLRATSTAEFGAPARRPANSVLDCRRIEAAFGISQPDWRAGLLRVLARLRG
jgi:dTDP-4-dehydrorhamnose reductase